MQEPSNPEIRHRRVSSSLSMKLLLVLTIALLFIQTFVEAKSVRGATEPSPQEDAGEHLEIFRTINCSYECSRRCSKASRRKICLRACKSCCARCHCVPPGTYGNKDLCPCYANLKTHGNKPKCP